MRVLAAGVSFRAFFHRSNAYTPRHDRSGNRDFDLPPVLAGELLRLDPPSLSHCEMAPKPGDKLVLTISDVAFGGEGVGRHEDFVVFVPFVLAAEVVEVEIIEVKKRFARARLLRVVEPSAARVAPACPYFGDCGGCQYQHVEYTVQLSFKHKQISDLFQRIG